MSEQVNIFAKKFGRTLIYYDYDWKLWTKFYYYKKIIGDENTGNGDTAISNGLEIANKPTK